MDNGTLVQGLGQVVAALDPGLHPLTVDHWFTTANDALLVRAQPVSPIGWLKTGGMAARVVPLAQDL